MTLSPDQALGGAIAAMSLVRNDFVPELSLELEDRVQSGQLIINLRAEAAPSCCAKSSPNRCTRCPARRQSSRHRGFSAGLPDADPSLHERARVISDFSPCGMSAARLRCVVRARSMTRILYCHCAYAQVVPKATKEAVLEKLCASGVNSRRAPIFVKCPRAKIQR